MRWVKQALGYRRSGIDEKTAGKGVCAAILDTGIARHPDLDGRIADFKDFTGRKSACYDDSGHGTHVAGILAGNGKLSAGMYSGMAPAATLLAAKVLDCSGNGNVESVLRGIEWLKGIRKEHPLRIVNISVGTQPELKEEQKARLLSAVEELWDEGLVVVASAGNYGPGEGTVAVTAAVEGDHCGGAGYAGGSGSCRPHEAEDQLFWQRPHGGLCGEAGSLRAGGTGSSAAMQGTVRRANRRIS